MTTDPTNTPKRNVQPRQTPGTLAERSKTYLIQSKLDLKEARISFRQEDLVQSAFLSVQAGVNALTAICLAYGQPQLQGPSPQKLFQLCMEFDPELFGTLQTPCESLERASSIEPFRPQEADAPLKKQCQEWINSADQIHLLAKNACLALGKKTGGKRMFNWRRSDTF